MFDVEYRSTTRQGLRWRLGFRKCLALTSVVAAIAASLPLLGEGPAVADPLSDAQAQAQSVEAQIQSEGQRLDILSQQYDSAQEQVAQLQQQITALQSQIAGARANVVSAETSLRQEALNAYMNGTDDSGLPDLFSSGAQAAAAADEYRSVSSGNLTDSIDALDQAQANLKNQEANLKSTQVQAQAAVDQVQQSQQQAQQTQTQLQSTENGLQGQIKQLVAQQQAAAAAAAQAAFEAKVAAQQQAAAAAAAAAAADTGGLANNGSGSSGNSGGGGVTYSNPPVAQGASGAVAAAESQLGVPYVYGGEQPGVGFDCSGLTQWSWGQAGVSLPRTAQEQYDAIAHISLADLEPGDLLFWDDGTSSVQHVAMYVGNGEIIQAPETGETVSYSTIWPNGLVGAGRP